jgi:hypothetical protein
VTCAGPRPVLKYLPICAVSEVCQAPICVAPSRRICTTSSSCSALKSAMQMSGTTSRASLGSATAGSDRTAESPGAPDSTAQSQCYIPRRKSSSFWRISSAGSPPASDTWQSVSRNLGLPPWAVPPDPMRS